MKFTVITSILVCTIAILAAVAIGHKTHKLDYGLKPEYTVALTGNL